MAVLHDYKCEKHGYFEGFEAKCPMKNCLEEVYVVFLQAPGLVSENTKKNDKTLNNLASDFGMSDIKSTREGENQQGYYTRNNSMSENELNREREAVEQQQREARPGDAAIWGGQGGMTMGNILRGGMFKSVNGESVGVNPHDAGKLTGPKAASYIADHENLTVNK